MIQDTDDGALLTIHVQPKAARTEYVGVHGDALKFRVAAAPVDGAANDELCRYLGERFGLSKGKVLIRSGQAGRRKQVVLKQVFATRVRQILNVQS